MRISGLIFLIAACSAAHAQDVDDRSFELVALYTSEVWRGTDDEGARYLDNLDLVARLDAGRSLGIPGLELFVYGIYNNGHALEGALADTVQGVSSIEAPRAWRWYEAWAQWSAGDAFSLRAGLYDLNSEFDSIEAAGTFINPSHGIGPDLAQTGLNGPSIFPVTGLALRARADIGQWTGMFAVLEAVPGDIDHPEHTTVRWNADEGFLYVAELNHRFESNVRTGFGAWAYGEAFDDLVRTNSDGVPVRQANNWGSYLFVESAEDALALGRGYLHAFARIGWANACR
jgi:porin